VCAYLQRQPSKRPTPRWRSELCPQLGIVLERSNFRRDFYAETSASDALWLHHLSPAEPTVADRPPRMADARSASLAGACCIIGSLELVARTALQFASLEGGGNLKLHEARARSPRLAITHRRRLDGESSHARHRRVAPLGRPRAGRGSTRRRGAATHVLAHPEALVERPTRREPRRRPWGAMRAAKR
jgi:hypothetical protein